MSGNHRASHSVALAAVCSIFIAAILLIDGYLGIETRSVPVIAGLDTIGHMATTLVFLAVFLDLLQRWFIAGAVIGTSILDLGHIPVLLSDTDFTHITARPVSHSLLIALILIAPLLLFRGRYRVLFVGLTVGMASHLFRDAATGGIPFFWPVSEASFEVGYAPYILTLGVFAALPLVRALIERQEFNANVTNFSSTRSPFVGSDDTRRHETHG